MKFSSVLALFAILAMVAVASGVTIPVSYDMEGLTAGISSHGQSDFVAGLYYSTVPGYVTAAGGIGGSQAIGGRAGWPHGGAAVFISNGTGLVDITLDVGSNWREEVRLAGDGTYATWIPEVVGPPPVPAHYESLNYVDISVFQNDYGFLGYEYAYYIKGNGLDTEAWVPTGGGGTAPPSNWLQLHFSVDIPANTMLIEMYDIDDTTGAYEGGWFRTVYSGASPFATSVDVVEFGAIWSSPSDLAVFDNLVLTPEPATLSLRLIGGLVFLRRRTG